MTLRAHRWLTVSALVLIFAAGSAFAWILFSAKSTGGHRHPQDVNPDPVPPDAWIENTLERLQSSLDLRPDQINAIREDIENAGLEVEHVREGAMLEYYLLLLRLHIDIAPKLDGEQRRILEESREALETSFERRFSSLIESR